MITPPNFKKRTTPEMRSFFAICAARIISPMATGKNKSVEARRRMKLTNEPTDFMDTVPSLDLEWAFDLQHDG